MQRVEFQFDMGQAVKHTTTGYTGTVMGQARYFSGCLQYLVRPEMTAEDRKTNKWPEGHWLDEPELEVVAKRKARATTPGSVVGGPQDHPPTD